MGKLVEGVPPKKGTVDDLTFYQMSDDGIWYVRKKSSIDRKRILKSAKFQGFRNSSVRMKDASPIASKVYRQLVVKHYPLFREMTGKALVLLKFGLSAAEVEAELVSVYLPKPAVEKPVILPFPRFYTVIIKCAVNTALSRRRVVVKRE
jgi:hypothetical protein